MVKRIGTYLDLGHHYYGLEIGQKGDRYHFLLVNVKTKGQELVIQEKIAFLHFNEVLKYLKPSIPLFLTINTNSTITKSTGNSRQQGRALANSIFPNLDYDALFFESYRLRKQDFVSIINKKEVKGILNKLKEAGVVVFSFCIGLSGMAQILDFVHEPEIHSASFSLVFDPLKEIITASNAVTEAQETYDLNGLEIQGKFLLAFGAVVSGIAGNKKESSNFFEIQHSLKDEYKNRRRLSLIIRFSLSVVLIALLINFMFYDHYFNKVQNLNNEKSVNETNIKRLEQVRQRVTKKENRVTKALSSYNSSVSYYLDQIARTVPKSLVLNELAYQPLSKPKRISKPIDYEFGEISVIGETDSRTDFIDWITQMERFEWVDYIETLEFDYQNQNSSLFKVNITLVNENE